MGSHPANLALRFVLEMWALGAIGAFGWTRFDTSVAKWLSAIGLPLVFMVVWGAFAVSDDPSRSGAAPIPIAGLLRLALELVLLGLAAASLVFVGHQTQGWIYTALVLGHYALSWDRVAWLFAR
jgi:hypothetical protein